MRIKLILVTLALFTVTTSWSQELKKPAAGKSLVYFIRSSGTGALINFKYFDGEKYLGKINGRSYFTYECEPGEHVFWVAAENRDYLVGNLEANKTYIIEVRPTMGAFKSAVRLHQVSPDDHKKLKKLFKTLLERPEAILLGQEEDMAFFIKTGMERYERIKKKVKVINQDWVF